MWIQNEHIIINNRDINSHMGHMQIKLGHHIYIYIYKFSGTYEILQ